MWKKVPLNLTDYCYVLCNTISSSGILWWLSEWQKYYSGIILKSLDLHKHSLLHTYISFSFQNIHFSTLDLNKSNTWKSILVFEVKHSQAINQWNIQSPLHILRTKSIMMTYLASVVHVLLFVFKFLQQIRLKVHIKSATFPMEKIRWYF